MPDLALDSREQEDLYDEMAERVRELWAQALDDVMEKVAQAKDELEDGYTVERLSQIEAEIKATIDDYREPYLLLLREGIEAEIERVNGDLDPFLLLAPSDDSGRLKQFSTISEDLIDGITYELTKGVDGALERAGRVGTLWSEELRRMQLDNLILSSIEGEGIPERRQRIIDSINRGEAKMPDGWKGSVESYAEMVARTNMAEAARKTTMARAVAAGVELFQVSVHGATDACGAFEGRIYGPTGNEEGVSGKVSDILASRPWIWHPNCRHQLLPFIPSIASKSRLAAAEKAGTGPIPSEDDLKEMNNASARLKREAQKKKESLVRDAEEQSARNRS